jgi:signal peptidase I
MSVEENIIGIPLVDPAHSTGSSPSNSPAPAPAAPRHLALRIVSWAVMTFALLVVVSLVAVTAGPRVLPYQALVVRSGSMSPTIPTGSIVFYRKIDAAKVKVGQVIVFNRPGVAGERVTHRVVKIGTGPTGKYFETKGDANASPDDWRIPAVGTGWRATFHVPKIGYLLADLQSTTARLLLLLIPALGLGIITLSEMWRERKRGASA